MKTLHFLLLALALSILPASAGFEVANQNGRIAISDGGKVVFAWQLLPLTEPKGGPQFAGSAFIHPLCSPSGFTLTQIQPDDHLHHFGLWWPWKMLEVEGRKFNTWEIQDKQGRHVADKVEMLGATADEVSLRLHNRFEISRDGAVYQTVISEQATLRFSRLGKDAYALDLDIAMQPAEGAAVKVASYRYSGFSWRGPAEWNVDNSVMRTSGGHNRDNANHQPADWLSVEGATPQGRATLLIMSAAARDGGKPELLRVWDSKAMRGTPFANFNPVVKDSPALTADNRQVSQRKYRVVIADRAIDAAEAAELYKAWGK